MEVLVNSSYLKQVSNETISDDCDGTLPERVTIEIVIWAKHASHQGKTDDSVEVEHNQAQNTDP